ncbi:OsmC family protein [Lentilitoribacter sp. EG35]|uniref:OsmC family protein n=1 Tax=Lentilitoribacter sp. EG35 TaxID=3234192 RepID=UPI003460E95F
MNVQTKSKTADNGVNVDALLGAREALTAAPQAANFTWRAECKWLNGMHSRSTMTGFFGLGEEHTHKTPYNIDADHPECFAAEDDGATPTEIVLAALASCLTGGVASVAQHRGIQLRAVTARVEGDLNVYGVLGMDPEIRNGFNAIRVSFDIDSDASIEEVEAVVAQSQKLSPVFDIIANPGNVKVTVG